MHHAQHLYQKLKTHINQSHCLNDFPKQTTSKLTLNELTRKFTPKHQEYQTIYRCPHVYFSTTSQRPLNINPLDTLNKTLDIKNRKRRLP